MEVGRQTPPGGATTVKNPKISRDQPAKAEPAVAEPTPPPDPQPERRVSMFIVNIGGSRYEMTRYSEIREITKGPAQVIEMPGPSAGKRQTESRAASVKRFESSKK